MVFVGRAADCRGSAGAPSSGSRTDRSDASGGGTTIGGARVGDGEDGGAAGSEADGAGAASCAEGADGSGCVFSWGGADWVPGNLNSRS